MKEIKGLQVFSVNSLGGSYSNAQYNGDSLNSSVVRKVVCCALGPVGNNIEQAAILWARSMKITGKTEIILRDTPEACLELARSFKNNGVLAVFWTCAVYAKENEFFFCNPDVYPFFFQQEMPLDEMQLATRKEIADKIDGVIPIGYKVASHPSPAPLVRNLHVEVILHNSNAAAAKACAEGKTELCITTESARRNNRLVKIHSFGSPNMVFFGGITQYGFDLLSKE